MMVNCAVYRQGQKLADIPVADISDYVVRPDCFVWVAVRDPDRRNSRLCSKSSSSTTWRSIVATDVCLYSRFRKTKWL
jgi:hypothetical protein